MNKFLIGICLVVALMFTVTDNSFAENMNNPALYPQMWTEKMLERVVIIESRFPVKFLGAYTPGGKAWIIWSMDKDNGGCRAGFIFVDGSMDVQPCDFGLEVYKEVCKEAGNCDKGWK